MVSRRAYKALAAADVGIGIATEGRRAAHVPWTADVFVPDLAGVELILGAVGPARAVSERGRTLALSATNSKRSPGSPWRR